ncbi:MAG: IS30 family transposase [Pseudomonadota bacterium]|jgi:IS30 family transposase|nr:IS30 family transposase [Pseudomonadota bacterium]
MKYRQLTQTQRYQISALRVAGKSQRQIAAMLGCHSSTISRELRRNSIRGYDPERAQCRANTRRRVAFKRHKRVPWLTGWVSDRLKQHWSPEQIAGFMGRMNAPVRVSHQWIYELIHRDRLEGGKLWTYCRHRNNRGRKRRAKEAGLGKIPNRVGIECRPKEIEHRAALGHWEGDTVLQGHKQSGLVTLVERRSGYLLAGRLKRFTARQTTNTVIRLLKPIRGAAKTLTLDNGSEFAGHEHVANELGLAAYFCDPYCSGQRGTNENTNGLLRQYYPKGTNFARLSQTHINRVVEQLNNRPRKRLGYRTPAEVFWGEYSGAL